jgi:hypothetical protein
MPLYRFIALVGSFRYDDQEGIELMDDAAALEEASGAIQELMKNDAHRWDGWSIKVMEGDRTVRTIAFNKSSNPHEAAE